MTTRAAPTQVDASPGLIVTDHGVSGLLVLRAKSERAEQLQAVGKVLGVALPEVLRSATSERAVVRWMSPDAWLISVEHNSLEDIEAALLQALDGHGAVVDVSGGYVHLELSGPSLRDVLKMSTAYDVDPEHFVPGKVVGTTFAKASVLMRALESGNCELLVRRSFADYVLQWLDRASLEVGMRVVPSSE